MAKYVQNTELKLLKFRPLAVLRNPRSLFVDDNAKTRRPQTSLGRGRYEEANTHFQFDTKHAPQRSAGVRTSEISGEIFDFPLASEA